MTETLRARHNQPPHTTRAQEPAHPPVHGDEDERPWAPPSNLEAPPPRPGYGQRWVRISIRNEDDPANFARALREGWVPRKAESVEGFDVPRITEGKWAGCIGIHSLILCEMPLSRLRKRAEYVDALNRRQTQAVSQDLARESHPSMPITQTRVTRVTTGRRPPIKTDEETT